MKEVKKFDIIVIGAGAAGLNIAGFMNKAGFNTLLVEKNESRIGGDCLNFGCVPSKALIHASRIIHSAKEAEKFGLESRGKPDLSSVKKYIQETQNIIRAHENKEHFEQQGITVQIGEAKFTSKNTIEVGKKLFSAKKIILATGSSPRPLTIPGSENVVIHTNETIFDLEEVPENLAIIGGGPVGIEIGQAYRRLGANVTILERANQFLGKEDPEIAGILQRQLEAEGMRIILGAEAKRFEGAQTLVYQKPDGQEDAVSFDEVLSSIGRVTNFDEKNLNTGGITLDHGKLILDKHLRTTNKNVYALGDAIEDFQFTHAAEMHARVVISNLFSPFKKTLDRSKIAWVTYTDPEIATFGQQETELRAKDIPYEVIETDFHDEDRAIIDRHQNGKLKLFVSGKKLLGGTLIGTSAGEIVQELILTQNAGIPLGQLFEKTYPYPTKTRINKKVISEYFARKLTARNKALLHFAYKLFP